MNTIVTNFLKQTFLSLFLSMFCIYVSAKHVEVEKAVSVAQYLIELQFDTQIKGDKLILAYTATNSKSSESPVIYYVFNVENEQGFVIISGDDIARPVLGYSVTGKYECENLPPNFEAWMDDIFNAISEGIESKISYDDQILEEWNAYLNKNASYFKGTRAVNALISTTWDQDNPYYNQCPLWNSQRCLTGCVATSMAQIMKYHNHPAQGTGSSLQYNTTTLGINVPSVNFAVNYNFGSMGGATPTNSTQQFNVAQLMYHCGVSVQMDYSPNASGASSVNVGKAITNHFGYDKTIRYEQRAYFTDAQWISMLKQELDASRPMYYAGNDSEYGHAFVCDGYNNQNQFHFNWGWSGYYNGYYAVNPMPNNFFPFGNVIYSGWKPNVGGNQPYQIYLYYNTNLSASVSVVQHLQNFTASAQFFNAGWTDFPGGTYSIGLFNSSGDLIEVIGNYSVSATLLAGYFYITPFTINCQVPLTVSPGNYTIKAITKATGTTEWVVARGTNVFELPLQVTGSGATLNVNPISLDFENVQTGTTSTTKTVTVSGTNLIGNITWTKGGADQSAFNVTQNPWNTATGGTLNVTFSPTQLRAYSANITISSPGAESKTVTLSGTGISSGTGECNPATNLTVDYSSNCEALLTWQAPARTHSIYENPLKIYNTNITEKNKEIKHNVIIEETEMLHISDMGNFQKFELNNENLLTLSNENSITLTDEISLNNDCTRNAAWMTWIPDKPTLRTSSNGYTLGYFQRFATSDLTSYTGQYLTKVRFVPFSFFPPSTNPATEFSANPRIQVYVGGSYNGTTFTGGTMVADVEVSDYTFNYDNFVEFNPILINGTQEIWFGVIYAMVAGFPVITIQNGTAGYIYTKTDLMLYNNNWTTAYDLFTTNPQYGWYLAAYTRDQFPSETCDITVVMDDEYGDGWNDGYLSFLDQSGTEWDRITLNGEAKTLTVPLPKNVIINCHWTPGNYDDEISFVIKDNNGNIIYTCNTGDFENQSSGAFYSFTNNACGSGSSTLYNVYRDNVLIAANINTTTYTDTGFNTQEGHTWSVKVVCSEDNESDPISITKPACYVPGNTAYGIIQFPAAHTGYWMWDVNNITGKTLIKSDMPNLFGGTYFNGNLYAFESISNEDNQPTNVNFFIINPVTGNTISSVPRPELYGSRVSALAYDYSNSTMYAVRNNTLNIVNLTTGELTTVANITGFTTETTILTLAVN